MKIGDFWGRGETGKVERERKGINFCFNGKGNIGDEPGRKIMGRGKVFF